MENYKIKVNNEAESKEAQDLFEQLGFTWAGDYPENGDWYSHLYAEKSSCCHLPIYVWNGLGDKFQELTLPQLRDLVVLHRNDVKDATHTDKCEEKIYLTADKVIYYWKGEWCKSAINNSNDYEAYIANSLTPIKQPEEGLITWADALRALADGKEVLWRTKTNAEVKSFRKQTPDLDLVLSGDCNYRFWIKPCTITLNLEIPAPFEPKSGDVFYALSPTAVDGYSKMHITDQKRIDDYAKLGAWRTEEEIKQVVAALRGGIKG